MLLHETIEQFSRFCRTGKLSPSIPVDPKRAQIYFTHVKMGITSALKKAYPLTCHLLKLRKWNQLMEAFLKEVDCATPFLWRMPQFLVGFIQKNEWDKRFKLPYLPDLVDFEWLEIEVFMMPDCPEKKFTKSGKLLDDLLIINQESVIKTYSYPVFEKQPLPRPMKKGMYPLLTFRHPDTHEVHFIALSPFYKTVLEFIQHRQMTGRDALMTASKEFDLNTDRVMMMGEEFLKDMIDRQAIYGFSNNRKKR